MCSALGRGYHECTGGAQCIWGYHEIIVVEHPQCTVACEGPDRKGKGRNGQGFQFPDACYLCHVQINYSGPKHDKETHFVEIIWLPS